MNNFVRCKINVNEIFLLIIVRIFIKNKFNQTKRSTFNFFHCHFVAVTPHFKWQCIKLNICFYFSVDFQDLATFTLSQKRNLKLIYKGFGFLKDKTNERGDITYWACAKRRFNCKGKAQTRRIDGKEMVKIYREHNHPPDDPKREIWSSIVGNKYVRCEMDMERI